MRIAFIGAGSTVFTRRLLGDILLYPELAHAQVILHDIDGARLEQSLQVGRILARRIGRSEEQIQATQELDVALSGADYVLTLFQIGGYQPCTVTDFEIPRKYGLRQTIGDTMGIGGIMRAARTIPVFQDLLKRMEYLCPNAWLLNYVNPMAMIMWSIQKISTIRSVGLCHSVPHTLGEICYDLGISSDGVDYTVGGINHLAFFLKLQKGGVDLYPQLRKVLEAGRVPEHNKVRYDLFDKFGYFVTESSEHLSEYVPWYIKRAEPELIEKFNIPLDEYLGRCQLQNLIWQDSVRVLAEDKFPERSELEQRIAHISVMDKTKSDSLDNLYRLGEIQRSEEYGSKIIHSLVTGEARQVYGNIRNGNLIENLPADCCVEVPCTVGKNGLVGETVGRLPVQLASLIETNILVQRVVVEAVLERKRELLYHAALLDPHTAAELSTDSIVRMVDELLIAHKDWLPTDL